MENQRKPRKYGDFSRRITEKREETADDLDEKEPCTTTRLHSKTPFFLSPSLDLFRKEKEEIKRNGLMEKRRKRGRKCGAEWLTAGGRRARERSILRIKNFVPNGENKGNNDCLLTTVKELN